MINIQILHCSPYISCGTGEGNLFQNQGDIFISDLWSCPFARSTLKFEL